jgi:hypothetical protein
LQNFRSAVRRPRVLEDDVIDFEGIKLAGTVAINGAAVRAVR